MTGARDIAARVRDGRLSAASVARDMAAAIAMRDGEVRAWAHLDLEHAGNRAESLDAVSGEPHQVLRGVPIGIKDIIDVAGMPTRFGSPIYDAAAPAPISAACVDALERAGAIVPGKTVTTEFAYYTPGRTRNPWNTAHTPGGSSMGSAAAVACGMVAGALGTQTNGSVIRPAAFCGVVGYKPSFGLISNHGTLDPWPTLDHTGVFARGVPDAALLASVIAKPGAIASNLLLPSHAPRLAMVRSPVWHLAEPAQKAALETAATALIHSGAQVETIELPAAFREAHGSHFVIMAYEGARHFGELQQRFRARMSPRLNALLDEGAAVSREQYDGALHTCAELRRSFGELIYGFDAILTPPAAGEAPATLEETGSPAFCTIWTLLGVPAITIPVALGPSRLPLGLQLAGAPLADDRLLTTAAWCEAHLPFDNALSA